MLETALPAYWRVSRGANSGPHHGDLILPKGGLNRFLGI